jgi:hypothetical protein
MTSSNGYYDDNLPLEKATEFLRELLIEFPFSDWRTDAPPAPPDDERFVIAHGPNSRSQAVQVAAMLSQFCTGLLPANEMRLGFIYNANSQRSGKSLLAKLAIVPANGRMAVADLEHERRRSSGRCWMPRFSGPRATSCLITCADMWRPLSWRPS